MARVKRGVPAHRRHKRILERAKGFRLSKKLICRDFDVFEEQLGCVGRVLTELFKAPTHSEALSPSAELSLLSLSAAAPSGAPPSAAPPSAAR